MFESFRYHEYQSGIIFAVVKHLPVTELSFFFKVLVDNPEDPVNTKESSIGLPYCGYICKCYGGIDIEEEGIGWVSRGGDYLPTSDKPLNNQRILKAPFVWREDNPTGRQRLHS